MLTFTVLISVSSRNLILEHAMSGVARMNDRLFRRAAA
ncbi:hypothetical protein TR2A62_1773 [Thalassobium sp. R2A62]|nr:hypothetical protein TR2A62_1773 [Thalassobium sp. R2A62]